MSEGRAIWWIGGITPPYFSGTYKSECLRHVRKAHAIQKAHCFLLCTFVRAYLGLIKSTPVTWLTAMVRNVILLLVLSSSN